jgi:hypothetical protein
MSVRAEIRPAPRKTTWWRRPWIGPLALLVLAFLSFSLPPYLAFDPARSRVPQPDGFPAHYWFLVAHVIFGSIAMAGAVLQIWPWLRRTYPVFHRYAGRAYVFAGVLPSGIMALTIGSQSPFGPTTRVSDVLAALLWIGCTLAGWRAVRERRFDDHRRWMIRSAALTFSILVNRLITPIAMIVLEPRIPTLFGGSELAYSQSVAAISAWGSVAFALILSQLYLDRRPTRIPAGVQ